MPLLNYTWRTSTGVIVGMILIHLILCASSTVASLMYQLNGRCYWEAFLVAISIGIALLNRGIDWITLIFERWNPLIIIIMLRPCAEPVLQPAGCHYLSVSIDPRARDHKKIPNHVFRFPLAHYGAESKIGKNGVTLVFLTRLSVRWLC